MIDKGRLFNLITRKALSKISVSFYHTKFILRKTLSYNLG